MTLLPPELRDLLLSIGAAAAGRVLLMLRNPPQSVTVAHVLRTVLWEIPIVCATGFLGYWIGAVFGAPEAARVLLIAILAHYGPTKIDQVLDLVLARITHQPKP